MANAVTRLDLKTQVLDITDMTGSAFAVDARLNDYLDAELSELHDLLVTSYEDYKMTVDTITLVGGTESYALPSDFYKSRRVWYKDGGRRYRVKRYELSEIDGHTTSPLVNGTIEFWYIPQYTKLATDGTVVDVSIPVGWEDMVVQGAAARLAIREESDPKPFWTLKANAIARIKGAAPERDAGEPHRVSDSYSRWGISDVSFNDIGRSLVYDILGDKIYFHEEYGV